MIIAAPDDRPLVENNAVLFDQKRCLFAPGSHTGSNHLNIVVGDNAFERIFIGVKKNGSYNCRINNAAFGSIELDEARMPGSGCKLRYFGMHDRVSVKIRPVGFVDDVC